MHELDTNRDYYIYVWYIVETNEIFYVGKGKGKRYKSTSSRNKFFTDIYNSHDCNVYIVQNNLTEEEAFNKEKELIKYYRDNTNYRLTNICDGGEGTSGYHLSDEAKQKISIASKQKWKDPIFREKEMYHRQYGIYKSEEFRNKISKLVKGKNNPNYNHHWSEEQREYLSKLRKQNGKSAGVNNTKATKIICLETGEIFDLIKDAMEKYNVKNEGSFTVALNNPQKTAANLHWKRYNDDLLNDDIRFAEYLKALSQSRFNSYICIETKKIYRLQKELMKELKLCQDSFNSKKQKDGTIVYNNKTYMLIKHYLNSPYC